MKSYHLTKTDDTWKLTQQGADRASKVFTDMSKVEAIRAAADFAQSQKVPVSVKIHNTDGKIGEERTYPGGADPHSSKG